MEDGIEIGFHNQQKLHSYLNDSFKANGDTKLWPKNSTKVSRSTANFKYLHYCQTSINQQPTIYAQFISTQQNFNFKIGTIQRATYQGCDATASDISQDTQN